MIRYLWGVISTLLSQGAIQHARVMDYGSVYCCHRSLCDLEQQLALQSLVGRLASPLSEDVVRRVEHAFNRGTQECLAHYIACFLRKMERRSALVKAKNFVVTTGI